MTVVWAPGKGVMLTRLDVPMRIRSKLALGDALLCSRHLPVHQRLLLDIRLIPIHVPSPAALALSARLDLLGRLLISPRGLAPDSARRPPSLGLALPHAILMHRL